MIHKYIYEFIICYVVKCYINVSCEEFNLVITYLGGIIFVVLQLLKKTMLYFTLLCWDGFCSI